MTLTIPYDAEDLVDPDGKLRGDRIEANFRAVEDKFVQNIQEEDLDPDAIPDIDTVMRGRLIGDDSEPVDYWITAALAAGANLYLSEGTYVNTDSETDPVDVPDGMDIKGSGVGTVIRNNPASSATVGFLIGEGSAGYLGKHVRISDVNMELVNITGGAATFEFIRMQNTSDEVCTGIRLRRIIWTEQIPASSPATTYYYVRIIDGNTTGQAFYSIKISECIVPASSDSVELVISVEMPVKMLIIEDCVGIVEEHAFMGMNSALYDNDESYFRIRRCYFTVISHDAAALTLYGAGDIVDSEILYFEYTATTIPSIIYWRNESKRWCTIDSNMFVSTITLGGTLFKTQLSAVLFLYGNRFMVTDNVLPDMYDTDILNGFMDIQNLSTDVADHARAQSFWEGNSTGDVIQTYDAGSSVDAFTFKYHGVDGPLINGAPGQDYVQVIGDEGNPLLMDWYRVFIVPEASTGVGPVFPALFLDRRRFKAGPMPFYGQPGEGMYYITLAALP